MYIFYVSVLATSQNITDNKERCIIYLTLLLGWMCVHYSAGQCIRGNGNVLTGLPV